MKINWKVRIKNKMFWLSLIPAVALLVQLIADLFGYKLELSNITSKLVEIVNAVFAVLVILGIVIDPTTAGVSDSNLAMTYQEPKEDDKWF